MSAATFNLLTEPWIPVLYHDGRWERVGIRQAFEHAEKIRDLAISNPMDRIALLRFLLVLVYWCRGNPPSPGSHSQTPFSFSDCASVLSGKTEYFNLLGDGPRFYQDVFAKRERATTDLLQEIPTGNNFWHFRHSTDFEEGLCLSCCALGLLRLPIFSVSGLPDLKAGINGTPPIYVMDLGASLAETFQLNWIHGDTLGEPSWSNLAKKCSREVPVPLLTGLTMLSRRVWLHNPIPTLQKCVGCGLAKESLVFTCEFQTAGEQKTDLWNDPHVLYTEGLPRKASKAQDLSAAGTFKMDRPWTYFLKSLIDSGKTAPLTRVHKLLVVGFATDKAKNIDVWEREIIIPPNGTAEEKGAELVLKWHKEGLRLEKRIGRWEKQRTAMISVIRPHVEHDVSKFAGELVTASEKCWDDASSKYRPGMKIIANALYPDCTLSALRRREDVSRMTPHMNSEAAPMKRKGGKKQ